MEVKKSPKADLESKKTIFMQIGLIATLAIVLIAFEWSSTDVKNEKFDFMEEVEAETEIVPITRQQEVKPPPPPPPPRVSDVLNIVDDDVELEEELELDTEMEEDQEVEFTNVDMEEEDTEDAPVFFIVEEMPVFPGGTAALNKYLASVKYPMIAQENGIQGRVYVQFVVNDKGVVEDVKLARGVDPNLDKAALNQVKNMPKWAPGKQRGKAVKVSYTVPINFVLQ